MMLDPLAEVRIGVLMTIMISRSQRVMNFQGGRKRRERQQDDDERERDHVTEKAAGWWDAILHGAGASTILV